MDNLTFNELPEAVSQLSRKLDNIERLLTYRSSEPQTKPDELLTVQDAAKFLSLSVPTIYGLIHKKELPVMKRSKRCYFSKQDLLAYLKEGKVKTTSEIEAEARQYLKGKSL